MLTWLGQLLADHELSTFLKTSSQISQLQVTPNLPHYLISGTLESIENQRIQPGNLHPHFWYHHLSIMAKNSGSVATTISQVQHHSNQANHSCNGHNVQLDQLGEKLTTSTQTTKKRFAPNEGMQLEVNACAPVPKKRHTKVSHTVGSSPGN